MWIRSQDKKTLIENKLFDVYQDLMEDGFAIQCSACVLGVYSTEEKALKVLDMIQREIEKLEIAKIEKGCVIDYNIIFKMPSDDEVE